MASKLGVMEIPLFPLHAVLAPGGPLPLHIFEPRYRALVADCLAAGTPFGVVCISAGREVGAGSVSFSAIGTLAEIREVTRFPDGRYDIMTMGTTRFHVERVEGSPTPYLVGIGDVLPELLGDPARVVRLAARVRSRFVRYLKLLQLDEEGEIAALIAPRDDPVALGHIVSGLVQVDLPRRQQLLEASTTEERLADLDRLLARETALLSRRLAPHALDPRLLELRRN
ncbi:MAG TPA: LON peptidase substrate-binding domain-containing protein [Candidatus Nanopelagicales bacterium]|nr:LON peptidase substrate-binding domain-containing protein [Candidatus Nanopelagicales bacterium]